MHWDFLGIIVLLLMLYSQIEMVFCVYLKQKGSYDSFFCFYNSYSITDYIDITREEKGRIGYWFWVFILSVILLVIAAVAVIASDSDFGPCIRINPEDIWTIL